MLTRVWICSLGCLLNSIASSHLEAEDWPRFRGPNASGISKAKNLPEIPSEETILWQVDSGDGGSSPVVVRGRVFFTSFEEDSRILHCLDAVSGEPLWAQAYTKRRDEIATKPCGPATPTPVADEHSIYAFFADTGLVCCSIDGEKRWEKDLGPFQSFHGISSSPILVKNKVVLLIAQLQGSFLAAFDRTTGDQIWKVDRVNGTVGGYATPTVNKIGGDAPELIVPGPFALTGVDPESGRTTWMVRGVTNAPISGPVISGNRVFVCEPFYESNPFDAKQLEPYDKDKDGKITLAEVASDPTIARLLTQIDSNFGDGDKIVTPAEINKAFANYVNSGGLAAIELGGKGDVSDTHIQWIYEKTVPQVASTIHLDGVTYAINDGGVMIALDAESGELLRQDRLSRGGRQFYASPVSADKRIFVIDTNGRMTVVKAEPRDSLRASKDWREIRQYDFAEPCFATPAISNDRLYVRTASRLYCFGRRR